MRLSDARHEIWPMPDFPTSVGLCWVTRLRHDLFAIANTLVAYDIAADGHLVNRRQFSTPNDRGLPDGSCRDQDGGIWTCRVAGGVSGDPQAPWQKGSAENMNKRVRRYLPRETVILAPPDTEMVALCDRLNATPRKCLGFRTPAEAFRDNLTDQGRVSH